MLDEQVPPLLVRALSENFNNLPYYSDTVLLILFTCYHYLKQTHSACLLTRNNAKVLTHTVNPDPTLPTLPPPISQPDPNLRIGSQPQKREMKPVSLD